MTASPLARGDVVCPVDTSDVERDVLQLLGHGEVASGVDNLWEVDEMGFVGNH
jgi:hypothetical protein